MVISSLVVETEADAIDAVAQQLASIEGVEVHEKVDGYKIVVTIEAETVDDSHSVSSTFIQIPGVLGINLIYFNFEDDKTIYPDGVSEE